MWLRIIHELKLFALRLSDYFTGVLSVFVVVVWLVGWLVGCFRFILYYFYCCRCYYYYYFVVVVVDHGGGG